MVAVIIPFEGRRMTGVITDAKKIVEKWLRWFQEYSFVALGSDADTTKEFCLDVENIQQLLVSVKPQFNARRSSIHEVDAYNSLASLLAKAINFTETVKNSERGSTSNTNQAVDYLQNINFLLSRLECQNDVSTESLNDLEQQKLDLLQHSSLKSRVRRGIETVVPITKKKENIGMARFQNEIENQLTLDVIDVIIITALQKERESVLRILKNNNVECESDWLGDRSYHRFGIPSAQDSMKCHVALFCTHDMGNLHAALATQNVIIKLKPKFIVLTGIAGGIRQKNDKKSLGDVIVSDQILYYEPVKQTPSETQFRHRVYDSDSVLLRAAKALKANDWLNLLETDRPDRQTDRIKPAVHFGMVASGETLVSDQAWSEKLQDYWSQLIGIEMEGAGVSLAAKESGLRGMLLVKGISDWADDTKNDDWQKYASETAASFVIALIKSGLPNSRA